MIVTVQPETLSVTRICEGEHVVTGGDDGQVWIATFYCYSSANSFVLLAKNAGATIYGVRQPSESSDGMKP